jgi:ribosomal protein L17
MTNENAPRRSGFTTDMMRNALYEELHRKVEDGDSPAAENLRLIVRKMVDKAREGDVASIREVFDRTDGKALPAAATADDQPRKVVICWKGDETSADGAAGSSS